MVVTSTHSDHPAAAARDDQELVDAFRAGEVGAFEELYRRHQPVVMRRLGRMCGNQAVAEEIAQEAFLRAAQRIATARSDLHFRAWVLRIAINLGIDHLRALRRHSVSSLDEQSEGVLEDSGGIGDTRHQVELREESRFVAEVLKQLNPRHRRVLVLREIEGLDYRAIAARLDTTCSAVETLLFRARGRFRETYARMMVA